MEGKQIKLDYGDECRLNLNAPGIAEPVLLQVKEEPI
jgi:hypothetical protein